MLSYLDGVTNTDAIRAMLGVGEEANEMPDEFFTARMTEGALRLEITPWIPDTLENLKDAAAFDPDEYGADVLIWDAVQQAATYYCAWYSARTAAISLFQKLEDGQNAVTRPTFKLEDLLEQLWNGYSRAKEAALDLADPDPAVVNTGWMAGSASPTFDPVTG